MKIAYQLLICGWLVTTSASAALFCNPFEPDSLTGIESALETKYPGFPHITPAALQARMKSTAPLVLLDVREPSEFAISHLPGAIRIDPTATSSEVLRATGKLSANTEVVFYCAVGSRSSKLADRVGKALLSSGASSIANLRGGIFAWHNEGLAAANDKGATMLIHPYDDCREKLVKPPLLHGY